MNVESRRGFLSKESLWSESSSISSAAVNELGHAAFDLLSLGRLGVAAVLQETVNEGLHVLKYVYLEMGSLAKGDRLERFAGRSTSKANVENSVASRFRLSDFNDC